MVVASKHDPVYAAEAYYADFDARLGFRLSTEEPLNRLTYLRLLETWTNPEMSQNPARFPVEVFTLSTIPERVVAYEPRSIRPTVRNTIYHPFDYSYGSVSGISMSGPSEWRNVRALSEMERAALAPYLIVQLEGPTAETLGELHDRIIGDSEGYFSRLQAILAHYTTYQYEIGFTDDVSVGSIARFLLDTKTGDCTEFSNASALLARMAGIPARVVTGYLASSGLQTPAHARGLMALQQVVEPLRDFPLEELYLVTNMHHHSWLQVYMPDYGWVDVETTATAIPPMAGGNPNNMDVVIPIINPEEVTVRNFDFPWRLVLRGLAILAAAGLVGAYAFRYGRLAYYGQVARGKSDRAIRAIGFLLFAHLATEGHDIRAPYETPAEYADANPLIRKFASLYTKLRFRRSRDGEWSRESVEELRDEYRRVRTKTRRRGIGGWLRRAFTLRDLKY
jgi:hypothetical protein